MIPLDGGDPVEIVPAETMVRAPDLSPDGRSLAFTTLDEQGRPAIVVCELPACVAHTRLAPPGLTVDDLDGGPIRWTPDGSGIGYVNRQSQANIWIQPLDGSPPTQRTHFTDGRFIADFAWSHDGERLAVVRGTTRTDIVLYRGLQSRR